MTMRFHYQTISSYRVLPPKIRIIEDEDIRAAVEVNAQCIKCGRLFEQAAPAW